MRYGYSNLKCISRIECRPTLNREARWTIEICRRKLETVTRIHIIPAFSKPKSSSTLVKSMAPVFLFSSTVWTALELVDAASAAKHNDCSTAHSEHERVSTPPQWRPSSTKARAMAHRVMVSVTEWRQMKSCQHRHTAEHEETTN
jgi:hypothetical protein